MSEDSAPDRIAICSTASVSRSPDARHPAIRAISVLALTRHYGHETEGHGVAACP